MKNGSAPGGDGLTVEFYKFFWPKLKIMVTNTFNEAFASEELTYTQRQGIIILLHKGKDLPRDRFNNETNNANQHRLQNTSKSDGHTYGISCK